MKKAFSILTGYLLAFVIMTAGSGFTISQMVCLSSGDSSFSLTKQTDCCEDEGEKQTSFEETCCDFVNVVFSPQQFIKAENAIIADHILNSDFFVLNLFSSCFSDELNSILYNDLSPPPLHGKGLLFMYRSLLI